MSLTDTLFSPFGKEYCAWYYFWMVFMYIVFVFVVISQIVLYTKGKVKLYTLVSSSIIAFFSYFNFRLLYSICIQ